MSRDDFEKFSPGDFQEVFGKSNKEKAKTFKLSAACEALR